MPPPAASAPAGVLPYTAMLMSVDTPPNTPLAIDVTVPVIDAPTALTVAVSAKLPWMTTAPSAGCQPPTRLFAALPGCAENSSIGVPPDANRNCAVQLTAATAPSNVFDR